MRWGILPWRKPRKALLQFNFLVVPSVLDKLSLPSLLRYRWLYLLLAGFADFLPYLLSFDFFTIGDSNWVRGVKPQLQIQLLCVLLSTFHDGVASILFPDLGYQEALKECNIATLHQRRHCLTERLFNEIKDNSLHKSFCFISCSIAALMLMISWFVSLFFVLLSRNRLLKSPGPAPLKQKPVLPLGRCFSLQQAFHFLVGLAGS